MFVVSLVEESSFDWQSCLGNHLLGKEEGGQNEDGDEKHNKEKNREKDRKEEEEGTKGSVFDSGF